MKPAVGVIGGSGPLATLDIEKKILSATQKLASPLTDQDYFNLVVFNYSETYDRSDSVFFGRPDPLTQYVKYITSISALSVDLILLACNTAHMHLPILREKTEIPIISIIEKTTEYLRTTFPDCYKVGLISTKATSEKKLYHNLLARHGIETVTLEEPTQNLVMEAIYLIKAGTDLHRQELRIENTNHISKIHLEQINILKKHPHKCILLEENVPNPSLIVREAIKELKNKGCDQIIFGCTELPLVLPYLEKEPDLQFIDPNTIIAEAIVRALQDIESQQWSNLRALA